MRLSLCWFCEHAVPNPETGRGCSWSIAFRPVEGWAAKEVAQCCNRTGDRVTSYHVSECPKFLPDADEKTIADNYRLKPTKKDVSPKKRYGIVNLTTGDRYERIADAAAWVIDNELTTATEDMIIYYLRRKAKTMPDFIAYGYRWSGFEREGNDDEPKKTAKNQKWNVLLDGEITFRGIAECARYLADIQRCAETTVKRRMTRLIHTGLEFDLYGHMVKVTRRIEQ